MELKNLVKNLLGEINKISKSDAVVGGVRDAGKAKVMPLSKISIGFGTAVGGAGGKHNRGSEEADAEGEGGGAAGALKVGVVPLRFNIPREELARSTTPHIKTKKAMTQIT